MVSEDLALKRANTAYKTTQQQYAPPESQVQHSNTIIYINVVLEAHRTPLQTLRALPDTFV